MIFVGSDFSKWWLECYFVFVWESGVIFCVIFFKIDMFDDWSDEFCVVEDVFFGVDVFFVSC